MTERAGANGAHRTPDAERAWAYLFGFGLWVAVAAPAFLPPKQADSYPLSTYPMFTRDRVKTRLRYAEGLEASGQRARLPPEFVANTEPMQAMRTISLAVGGGPERMAALCQRVAERLQRSPTHDRVVSVRLVEGEFDSLGYFRGAREPDHFVVHHECRVPGRR